MSRALLPLFGTTTTLTPEQFTALYGDQAGFETAWNEAVDDAVADGFVLWSDQWKLKFLPEPAALAGLAAGGLALRALARRRRAAARD